MRIKGRIRAGKGSGKEIEKEERKREKRQKLLKKRKVKKDPQQSRLKETLIEKVDTMNNHLFMINDVLHHMMGEMKHETAVLQEITDARQLEREEAVGKRRSRQRGQTGQGDHPGDGHLDGKDGGSKRLQCMSYLFIAVSNFDFVYMNFIQFPL